MPAKINMFLSNGNVLPPTYTKSPINFTNLSSAPVTQAPINAPLNRSMISRIHNVRPGCGSCGRKG
jgi:hypothetical protein